MARNKDFFVNSAPKRDRSFFVKEEPKKADVATTKNINSNIVSGKDKYNSVLRAPVKQDLGDKIGNFFMNTIPNAAQDLWDDVKEPFTGPSTRQLMRESKLSPKLLVEDAKIQMEKENPTREDYALVKQTQDIIKKYGTDESNIRAISEDTTQLQKDLRRAEKTWQASPVDAAVANTGAAVTGIFGNLGSFANSLGADKVPLLREVTNFAVDGARKAQQNAQQYNKGNYGEALGTVTQGVVNLVPYFLIGTGSTAVKGATAVSKYGKYIEPIIKNPSFWYSLTSMWGQKYQEKLDEGYNRFQALGNAILYAFPASLIEVSGGIGAKGKEAQSLLRTMGEEIAEEIAQDIMSGVSDKITTNHDLPVFSMTEDAIINPKELGKTAIYTVPIVAIGGGANNVVNNSINNRAENQKVQAQINQDLQNLRNQNTQTPNTDIQLENVKGLPEMSLRKLAQNPNIEQVNAITPKQAKMPQNANMEQITDNDKNKLLNKIKNNQYMSQEEKNDLIATVNNTNITSEVETEINNILNTINEEFGLKNITSDFNSNKAKYAQYVNDKSDMDNSYIDNSKNAIDTKDGRRTKDQWLSIAKNLGSQIYEMSDAEIEKYAYRTWIENKPNNVQNLNRQGKKYIKFGLDEWVNTVYDSVREARNRVAEKPINTLPTQKAQETLQSAKIAGMTDMDIQKAKELNDMLRSGTRLNFYDEKTIPQNVQADKAKIANGFYKDGTLWINKNSKNKVEQILGHELTHHLETTDSYTDLSNTILDSEVFYDFVAEKGYANVAEYKARLKEMGYADAQLDNELVARFVEEKMFTDQKSIDRLARQNTKLVEKIKNWISDLVVSFKGTAQEKELRRIENMYRKALEQARNTTTSTETQYSYAGELGLNNLKNNRKYMNSAQRSFVNELQNNYEKAMYLSKTGAGNEQILKETGWFKSDGKWRWEIPDTLMTLKEDIQLEDGVSYDLADILEHDLLFMVYPELMKQQVIVDNGLKGKGKYSTVTKDIKLKVAGRSNGNIELTLLHEVQHAIQDKEGFEGGTSPLGGMLRYYEHKGEIEAADTTRRFLEERKAMKEGRTFDREKVAPELSKENPIHPGLNKYLASDKQTKIRDNIYKWSKGGANYESESFDVEDIELEDNETNNETLGQNNSGRRIAGKEPAFSMPETDNQGRTLSKEQQEFFKDSKVRDAEGNLKPVYHGTKRADRVGYYFDPAKATSGPMAFFTDDVEIATNYSKSKQDTSISREADTEYDLFKVNGKDLDSYWDSLSPKQKRDIAEKGNNIGFDEDWENVVYGENASEESFGDQYKWRLNREYNGNAIKALYGIWIEDGNLMFEDMAKFKDILNMAGIENVEYLDKFKEEPKVYEVYMNLKNPFVTSDINQEIINKLQKASENATIGEQYTADSWDKSNIEPKDWMSMLRDDIKNNTTHSWTIIPDWVTNVLKSEGYDGIQDTGGKYSGLQHNVYIPFYSNQIKETSNTNPTENPDIRYSMNPVEVAKNPPNIETGLDQLKRTSRVKEGDTQSSFTKNIYNQSIFDDKFKDLALDDKNIRSYASISNKETLQQANDAINEQGQKWVDRFLDKPNGEMKATDIAGGFILMNRYQQAGDYESMIRVAEKLRKAGTQQGQTIQMFSVLGRMTPEGMTYYAQKELSKAYDEILKNKTQKWADEHADEFKLNEKDIEYIQRRVNQAARLPEGRDKYVLLGEIASRIQNKIPPQAGQGLKALARNSMLLNPKTMVRNILGNVVIVPNHIVSDFVGAGIDKAISKKTGVRTTGGFDVKALQGAKKGIYESFDDFRRKISTREMGGDRFEIGQGKNFYENHTGRFGETRNKINKALNGLDRVTGFLLETGDRPFYETWFINSLNNQMKLNNVTEPTAEMIEIATDEALQRTWQDSNAYTGFVTNFRKGLNKLNIKGYGLGDIVMPFVKTPANLTKAVIDFSPLGAINAAVKTSQFNKDIGKGVATTKQQREVVKAWSQVITGTIGMAIMTAMANAGILGGGSDEDKDVRNFEQKILGIKPYSIKIGDNTYTYDWAQPLGTSAAMVADTVKSLKNAKDTEGKVAAALEGLQSGASVLLEQSFVSGIRQFFEEDGLISALIEAAFNEPTKFTPQFLSQLAQLQDDTERVSYVYNNIPQTAKNKIKAKIPGLRETLEPNIDVLGREVKTDNSIGNVMFNPANTAAASTTEAAEEMYRVYKATGEKSAIAQVAPYYFDVGSEKIVLTPKQKTQYQKTIGEIASDGVENLIDNKVYKKLSDADKAKILSELYSYGNAVAKEEASKKYLMPKDMQKIKDSGIKPEEYILLKYISNLGGTKKDDMYNSLISAGYTQKETEEFLTDYKGYKFESTSKNTLPTLSQQRAKLPTLKK
jgi:hypothetical protein